MNSYIHIIKAYLDQTKPNFGDADIHTLLDMLYRCYTEFNPINSEKIRGGFSQVDDVLKKLPMEDNNRVFFAVCALCSESERLAFREGLHVGLRLAAEIAAVES